MLSFDPRALLTPGGVINGAGNAIAALANVPANKKKADAAALRAQLAQQKLTGDQDMAQKEFGLKKGAQDYNQNPNNPGNAHLRALDANMLSPEQRILIAAMRARAAKKAGGGKQLKLDTFGGEHQFDPATGESTFKNPYMSGSPAQQALGGQPAPPAPAAGGSPAVQALGGGAPMSPPPAPPTPYTQNAPQVPGAGAAHVIDPQMAQHHLLDIGMKVANGTATPAEEAEFDRLSKDLGVPEDDAPAQPTAP